MILYEFEGKELLKSIGVVVPRSQLIINPADKIFINTPLVLKAQVLSGKRAQVGGIVILQTGDNVAESVNLLLW